MRLPDPMRGAGRNSTLPGLLKEEARVLQRLVYRSKNQHKTSPLLRQMTRLSRLLRGPLDRQAVVSCCQDAYIAGSAGLAMGYFIPLNATVMALAARVFFIVSRQPPARDPIDDIFSALS